MVRKALIIASPDTKHGSLPGARKDMDHFKNFLTSDTGGAWEPYEIVTLQNPSSADVKRELGKMSASGYAFITFSGHGSHHIGKGLSETSLCLNDTDEAYVYSLNPGNTRHLIVVDACRSLVTIPKLLDESLKTAMLNASRADLRSREECRRLFDEAVIGAEQGRSVMYSCEINQAAGEDSSGGVFTRSLVEEAYSFKSGSILTVDKAFSLAKTETLKMNSPQNPVLEAGRRIRHFPFAISTQTNLLTP